MLIIALALEKFLLQSFYVDFFSEKEVLVCKNVGLEILNLLLE